MGQIQNQPNNTKGSGSAGGNTGGGGSGSGGGKGSPMPQQPAKKKTPVVSNRVPCNQGGLLSDFLSAFGTAAKSGGALLNNQGSALSKLQTLTRKKSVPLVSGSSVTSSQSSMIIILAAGAILVFALMSGRS